MAMPTLALALRGTDGVWVLQGAPNKSKEVFRGDGNSECRAMAFSLNGQYFASCDEEGITVMKTSGYKKVITIEKSKISGLSFSPLGTYLISADISSQKKDVPNLCIWETATGKLLKGFFHKRMSDWKPSWTPDDKLMVRLHNNDVEFYENGNFDSPKTRLHAAKISEYGFSKSDHVAIYIPGSKGQPSNVRIFKYPNFNGCPLANKSFFKADKTTMYWNKAGTGLLVITSTETSDKSYYGETGLHYLSIKGEGCLVPRAKDGPVYCVEWHPNSTQFCVVYGFMPAKATVYNLKCDPVFDYGTAARNSAFYNPQGNILCLAGFGNLQGDLEFWDVQQQKIISSTKAMDTTYFCWCPDGVHFITATMAPRLRVGNGYKIWHYTGTILAELDIASGKELWESLWMPDMEGKFPVKPIAYKKVGSSLPAQTVKPVAAYRPPHARDQPASEFKLHEFEPPSNKKIPGLNYSADTGKKSNKKSKAQKQNQQPNIPGLAPVNVEKKSSSETDVDKNKKTKNPKKNQQPNNSGPAPPVTVEKKTNPEQGDGEKNKKSKNSKKNQQPNNSGPAPPVTVEKKTNPETGDGEKNKKSKNSKKNQQTNNSGSAPVTVEKKTNPEQDGEKNKKPKKNQQTNNSDPAPVTAEKKTNPEPADGEKNKKSKNSKKNQQTNNSGPAPPVTVEKKTNSETGDSEKNKKTKNSKKNQQANNSDPAPVTVEKKTNSEAGDGDKSKKIKNLKKKLTQINKLKEEQKSGKTLDKCQIEKVSKYNEIMKAINDLKLE